MYSMFLCGFYTKILLLLGISKNKKAPLKVRGFTTNAEKSRTYTVLQIEQPNETACCWQCSDL